MSLRFSRPSKSFTTAAERRFTFVGRSRQSFIAISCRCIQPSASLMGLWRCVRANGVTYRDDRFHAISWRRCLKVLEFLLLGSKLNRMLAPVAGWEFAAVRKGRSARPQCANNSGHFRQGLVKGLIDRKPTNRLTIQQAVDWKSLSFYRKGSAPPLQIGSEP
jgi:hypothetical protein